METYDLFVIGAGSGGVRAARMSAQMGAKVGICEDYRVGGTCVIRGCVPKKLLVYAAEFGDAFEDARGFGWTVDAPRFSWPQLIAAKDKEIDRLNGLYLNTLKNAGVTLHMARGRLVDAHTIALSGKDGETTVKAKHILIATGAWPVLPSIPGIEHAITSNEAFHLPQLPNRIAVVGGGYIAVEFAGIFHGLGAHTTLLYRGEQILRGFDRDMRDGLALEMRRRGVDVRVQTNVTAIERQGGYLRLILTDGSALDVDAVMFATGRNPNTRNLGLEAAGVALAENGAVKVDHHSQSSVPHIYAVGDVTDRVALTPVAIREGAAVAETLFGSGPRTVDYDNVPTAVFSQPEIGTVGLSEDDARAQGRDIDVYKTTFRPMKFTLAGREERTIMKLIVERATGKVIGAHMLGPDAAEIIQGLAIAIKAGARKADFDATVAIHPSAAEEFVLMREPISHPKAAE
jgi:glutathione reductase (NADPH)